MMSSRYYSITNHQQGSHSGIGTGSAEAFFCFGQRGAHEIRFPICCHDL
jgi:hypothetical protein